MRGPDGTSARTACKSPFSSPERPALSDTGGRVTIPFLPTLAMAGVLAVASIFCPNGSSAPPGPAARMIPSAGQASLAMAEPATPAPEPAPRPPAVIAFSEIYPLTGGLTEPVTTASIPAAIPAPASRSAAAGPAPSARPRRLAVTGRRPCAGRRCGDNPAQDTAPLSDPFAPAKPSAEDSSTAQATGSPVPSALPFAETVAEAVMPVAREVRARIGTRVDQITGTAGDLVRGGQSVVKGSVSLLADRLL